MADINKDDIKLMQSQRLDDSDQGGGQMTSNQVVSGAVNNLFPDISRLDRVYGRVSLRKAYASVQTTDRSTYYGSHAIMTKQVDDPGVSACFFSSKDWFDTREEATGRIEGYLVKGPQVKMALWGDHFMGTKLLVFFTESEWDEPELGDVLVIYDSVSTKEQYMRVTDVSTEIRKFSEGGADYYKKIINLSFGTQLEENLVGHEVTRSSIYSNLSTVAFETVAADTSRYYGVSTLSEDANSGELRIRVDDINTKLVPSAASETPIVDAGVGKSISPLLQTNDNSSITRQISFSIQDNAEFHIGEQIIPGTLNFSGGGINLIDDSKGNVYNGSLIIGSISYITGIIIFGSIGLNASGSGSITYKPACISPQVSHTGGIKITINNRGFVYVFNCSPLPQKGTLKVEYLAGGKWYSLWDLGNGQIQNPSDEAIGSGFINFDTGSVSVTLGAMPDIDSQVIFYWAKPSEYYDFSGETLPLRYNFLTNNSGVARNTFVFTWLGDANGSGPNGEYGIVDNGNSKLVVGSYNSGTTDWEPTATEVGSIKYATGEVDFGIDSSQYTPVANEVFTIEYNYGPPFSESFFAPQQNGNSITINLTNTPIVPGTFRIEWHTNLVTYDPETRMKTPLDPTYIYKDDGTGFFEGDVDDGTAGWFQGNINYTTGEVNFAPHRTDTFPLAQFDWVETAWHLPGVEESYVFTGIQYLPSASLFPVNGTVFVSYCTTDGTNFDSYSNTISPKYFIKENSALEIVPGGVSIQAGSIYILDGADGKLYFHNDGVTGDKVEVGNINYVQKTFSITSDTISLDSMEIISAVGTAAIDPIMSMVFRTPGYPIRAGSLFIKGTTDEGVTIEGSSDFSGEITGAGVYGQIDFSTGLCHVGFGTWVPDDAEAQASEWYSASASDGAGNVWKPYIVRASTMLINCVVTSYLPLDAELLGLNPVRLPLDGKVPIFRDGYVIVIHHSQEEYMPYPLGTGSSLPSDLTVSVGRTNVNLIEAYSMPTAAQLNEGTQVVPVYISETGNYTYDLELGEITFLTGFAYPTDSYGTQNQIIALSRIEDMCLASDVQVTGHIGITNALTHSYPMNETLVSSVLPFGDLQSRAYNEFEQSGWTNEWSDILIGNQPLASYNFVDYPITITNKASIQERWLILFSSSTKVSIVGENFGVLAENIDIIAGNEIIGGYACIAIENRQYPGEYYWILRCDGFGTGWASGNCIRFNTDPANYPLWFIRTTLQAPPTEPIDYYTLMIRGDSS